MKGGPFGPAISTGGAAFAALGSLLANKGAAIAALGSPCTHVYAPSDTHTRRQT
ncbi:hypothetical protein PF008_g30324 [Phytophthora fragariae]|uniref:Uncharacterized protein n=1 Tax=Phytophthora fragariae TaxID=53985 RepID=A0A6G0Q6D4_9STRA|nr:hypothetical protein PF008_g30324 [Phytophthora fragariae]